MAPAVTIPWPLSGFLSVVVRKEGFSAVTLWFPSPVREEEIPASYTLNMYPVETIGGVVQDEQGRPVAGVKGRARRSGRIRRTSGISARTSSAGPRHDR